MFQKDAFFHYHFIQYIVYDCVSLGLFVLEFTILYLSGIYSLFCLYLECIIIYIILFDSCDFQLYWKLLSEKECVDFYGVCCLLLI